jgi:hypothetical protein
MKLIAKKREMLSHFPQRFLIINILALIALIVN